jgi:hypothetical protein
MTRALFLVATPILVGALWIVVLLGRPRVRLSELFLLVGYWGAVFAYLVWFLGR